MYFHTRFYSIVPFVIKTEDRAKLDLIIDNGKCIMKGQEMYYKRTEISKIRCQPNT